ncbi:SDR family oxidoreductase [Lysinibacillus sp. BW-2-10]|uniref:SDR family oxidoreductase n=1 Tax=Lysinibacillus sp. BW-2-10 TaxID=2590030 RepID=UPI00118050C9|nr:SDR family oxidoreductase [Lysinibacillus sp. BW-2-10]TSI04207.1 SDR family oxidoreductase [Lysinibacillus sp. BW-2-10]
MGIHFFTGFPGFITSQLIRTVFKKGMTNNVAVVVLSTEIGKAEKESQLILQEYPNCHIEIIKGDITLPNLAISEETIKRVANDITIFWHLAAIYDLAVPRDLAWKVNVHGTSMVNNFVKALPNLQRYMYVSTAYVAGMREGVLLETELLRPTQFKNHYEETKYEAELLVEDLKLQVPLTIIRPGIVRGHSETGETIKFDGPYFFLNMIDRLKSLPFIPYIGKSSATINVVPIDFILNAATFICEEESAEGLTLHLTDPNPHPVQEVYRMMVKEMTGKSPKGRLPLALTRKTMEVKGFRKFLGVEIETLDYLTWNATFDCTQAKEVLKKGNITCADFIATIPIMVKFYNEHKHNKNYHIEIK